MTVLSQKSSSSVALASTGQALSGHAWLMATTLAVQTQTDPLPQTVLLDSSGLQDIQKCVPPLSVPSPPLRGDASASLLCVLAEIVLYIWTNVCGSKPLSLKQMREDPKHSSAPCFLRCMDRRAHHISYKQLTVFCVSSQQPAVSGTTATTQAL